MAEAEVKKTPQEVWNEKVWEAATKVKEKWDEEQFSPEDRLKNKFIDDVIWALQLMPSAETVNHVEKLLGDVPSLDESVKFKGFKKKKVRRPKPGAAEEEVEVDDPDNPIIEDESAPKEEAATEEAPHRGRRGRHE
jgi:hypothetical protein